MVVVLVVEVLVEDVGDVVVVLVVVLVVEDCRLQQQIFPEPHPRVPMFTSLDWHWDLHVPD